MIIQVWNPNMGYFQISEHPPYTALQGFQFIAFRLIGTSWYMANVALHNNLKLQQSLKKLHSKLSNHDNPLGLD